MGFLPLECWREWDFRITCGAASKGTLGIVQALCKVVATCLLPVRTFQEGPGAAHGPEAWTRPLCDGMTSCLWLQDGVVFVDAVWRRDFGCILARDHEVKHPFLTSLGWKNNCADTIFCREGTGKVQAGTMTLAEHKHVPSMALAAQVAWRVQGKVLRLYRAISMTVVRQCVPVLQNAAPWDRPRPAVGAAQWGWKATSSESRAAWDRQLSS
eukprot:gene17068-biopygen12782